MIFIESGIENHSVNEKSICHRWQFWIYDGHIHISNGMFCFTAFFNFLQTKKILWKREYKDGLHAVDWLTDSLIAFSTYIAINLSVRRSISDHYTHSHPHTRFLYYFLDSRNIEIFFSTLTINFSAKRLQTKLKCWTTKSDKILNAAQAYRMAKVLNNGITNYNQTGYW